MPLTALLVQLLTTSEPVLCNDLLQMRLGRLELPRPKTHVPETCASTNSATTAWLSPDGDWANLHHDRSWTPDRVLPVTNGSSQWYEGTPDPPSHPVSDPETHWYDWHLACTVDSGSAF
jgi:hypothetical protein